MNKTIVYINNDGFPNGMASGCRILSLSRGFIAHGYDVLVLCIRPTEKKSKIANKQKQGIIKGVKFYYTSDTVIWPDNYIAKLYLYIKGLIKGLFISKQIKPKAILLQPDSFFVMLFFKFMFKTVILYKPLDEYPPPILKNRANSLWGILYMKFYYLSFNCIICISESLEAYIKNECNVKDTIVVNMTVEIDRFKIRETKVQKCICYAGNMGMNNKDGIFDLILAFARIAYNHKDWSLKLIGDVSNIDPKQKQSIKNILDEYKIKDRVIFVGKANYEEIPNLLSQASILALTRPSNIQSEVSFPTKLGEYLAAGKPVLVTKFGEIEKFIINKFNGYLADPSNIEDISKQFDYIISHPEEWGYISNNAQKLVFEQFNYVTEAKKIINYIEGHNA